MFSSPLKGVLAAGSLLAITPLSSATVFNLQPTEDTWINSVAPDATNGADVELRMLGWFDIGARRPLLKFDLSSVPDDSTVLSAQLTLQQLRFGAGSWTGFPANVWRMPDDNWVEETATWGNYNQTGGTDVAVLQPPHSDGPRTWDIRIADWNYTQDLSDNAVTFQMRWGDELSQHLKDIFYSSKEGTVVPVLTLNAVPEPATLAVLSLGVLAFLRKRKA